MWSTSSVVMRASLRCLRMSWVYSSSIFCGVANNARTRNAPCIGIQCSLSRGGQQFLFGQCFYSLDALALDLFVPPNLIRQRQQLECHCVISRRLAGEDLFHQRAIPADQRPFFAAVRHASEDVECCTAHELERSEDTQRRAEPRPEIEFALHTEGAQ